MFPWLRLFGVGATSCAPLTKNGGRVKNENPRPPAYAEKELKSA